MDKDFERCCRFLAEMMEKYCVSVMQDILAEMQYDPEMWLYDAEEKRLRYVAYVKNLNERLGKVA